ncbi:MAG: branched-chain amino acid transport system II carrier protein [Eggerthellaceae bacterium]|nr:branched-chain amino acid transport system II carrier protein [Eggerthellaceae bacterium]
MRKETAVTGLALFAMFFGAGNLIFPPYLGMESGTLWPVGLLFFVLVDVVIACLGICALSAAGGGEVGLQRTIGKVPAIILSTAAIVCTGILIAMPRTAATTYEMAMVPIFGGSVDMLPFSIGFFAVVLALTITESKVVDIIGKVLTPLLVIGIGALIIIGIANPFGVIGEPISDHVAQDGILAGYQAMDVICVIGYTIVLLNALRTDAFKKPREQVRILTGASIIAGVLLAAIYGGLTYLGAMAGGSFGQGLDQAQLIVAITEHLMGHTGVMILGAVVLLACLTTAIGLISATAEYFANLTHDRLTYRFGVIFCVVCGILICNLELDTIIAWASPILTMVCPPFMSAIVLMLFAKLIPSNRIYQGAALGAFLASIPLTADSIWGPISWVETMPLFSWGFAWLPFAILGGVVGYIVWRIQSKKHVHSQ